MALEVYWTEFSERELENIFNYYKNKVNLNVAKTITDGIYNEALKLEHQPEMGQIEELLSKRNQDFRYLIYKNYKIIYWINYSKGKVEINDVFDTRQNPTKIERNR
ncbi:type II toxin-antitoxin system RelE/ParE family toxin [Flavobacterium sp. CS20]|jgi:plasmid stabilization system protein ParE|uniref:type II toxin-antitoxin system RelE/ParE family toxin n=1 Tax=Flavobacterium sp. CS20 TaxID=2775246 RepID=UPI001B3A32E1|nr:type II toxin-antitoxin system RelE/ParE family toxin [Flavobacterium sp. CS20]QTY27985.1 type II toxin-antitoxin system RelE/ParE family toxin [Flavobacterium sp. CS20]